jgi:uncharacterized membrane protein
MLQFFKKKPNNFFSESEKEIITSAIKAAERSTSGEVRVFIESKCRFMNALDRAAEVFGELNMQQTMQRNGVLLYVAMKDRQLAVFGDEGIHQKVEPDFWNNSVKDMVQYFNKENYAQGIAEVVIKIGNALKQHFPYDEKGDTNELSDEVVFGS